MVNVAALLWKERIMGELRVLSELSSYMGELYEIVSECDSNLCT